MELSSCIYRYPLQLSRLISFRNQLNLNKDLNGTELRHFQISSTAAETDFLHKSIEFQLDLNGTELRKLPALHYSCRNWFPVWIKRVSIRFGWSRAQEAPRSPLQLPRLISIRNPWDLNRDLNRTELRHSQISSPAAETVPFRNPLNLNWDLNGTELWHSQISCTAAETDFL